MTTPMRSAPRERGKTRLDRDTIVEAGLELAAAPGASSISVRELGVRLGADHTAIYRHFRSKEQLMQALLDEVIERSVADVTAPRTEWQTRLRQLAESTLRLFVQYPAIGLEAIVLTTHGPGELDAIEVMLDAFATAGLSEDDQVRHYALMASHVLATAAGIARGRTERGATAGEVSPWFEGPLHADARTHPRIAAVGPRLTALEDRDLFMLGVDAIIDSAERAAGE